MIKKKKISIGGLVEQSMPRKKVDYISFHTRVSLSGSRVCLEIITLRVRRQLEPRQIHLNYELQSQITMVLRRKTIAVTSVITIHSKKNIVFFLQYFYFRTMMTEKLVSKDVGGPAYMKTYV